jgi:diguanylate cyclase (GGDEF)-like protein
MTAGFLLLPAGRWWHAIAYAAIAGSCIAALGYAVRRYRPHQPSTWYASAAGLALWLLSNAMERVTDAQPWTTISGVLAVAGYPPMCLALVGFIRGRARASDRTGLLDAGIVATSLALPYWVFVVGPAVTDGGLPVFDRVEIVLYVAGDVAMLALSSLLVTTPGARAASYRLLIGALLVSMSSDILVVLAPSSPAVAGPADIAILISNTLVAAATVHPSMRRLTVPLAHPPAFVRPRLVLLVGAILLSPAVSLYLGATGDIGTDWPATGVSCVVLFLLVAIRMIGLVRRVESQAQRLAQLAYEDPLTRLPNRREWERRLPAAMAECLAADEPLLVGIIDLDHFKRYNDTYGHQAGDELLAEAATAWRTTLRDDDLLARYGGEEFALLLTGRTEDEALQIMQRMLAATPRGQTFSGGVAPWNGRQSVEDLLHRADELLYASKHAGRARVSGTRPVMQETLR